MGYKNFGEFNNSLGLKVLYVCLVVYVKKNVVFPCNIKNIHYQFFFQCIDTGALNVFSFAFIGTFYTGYFRI